MKTNRDEIQHIRDAIADKMLASVRLRHLLADEGEDGSITHYGAEEATRLADYYEAEARRKAKFLMCVMTTVDHTEIPGAPGKEDEG